MSLIRVSYISRQVGGDDILATMASVLAASRRNNPRLGITGALLVGRDGFAQVLEGPSGAVEELFERIQCDERHGDVTVLAVEPATSRDFPSWSMAGCDGREALRAAGLDLSDLARDGAPPLVGLLRSALATQMELDAIGGGGA